MQAGSELSGGLGLAEMIINSCDKQWEGLDFDYLVVLHNEQIGWQHVGNGLAWNIHFAKIHFCKEFIFLLPEPRYSVQLIIDGE